MFHLQNVDTTYVELGSLKLVGSTTHRVQVIQVLLRDGGKINAVKRGLENSLGASETVACTSSRDLEVGILLEREDGLALGNRALLDDELHGSNTTSGASQGLSNQG